MGKTKINPPVQGFESIRELGSAFQDTVRDDLAKESWKTMWKQFGLSLGGSSESSQTSTEQVSQKDGPIPLFDAAKFSKHDKKQNAASEKYRVPKPKEERRAAIDYAAEILKTGERAERKKENQTTQTVQELKAELKRLSDSSKILQMEFASVSVEQTPTKVGEYHANFLEWMLYVVRAAREKVEDSGAWLAAVKNKGGKRRWNNKDRKNWFENTKRSMSSEVNVSNSAG